MLKAAEGREIDFRFVRAPKGKSATNHHSFTLPTQGQPVLWPKPLTASSFAPLLPIPCPLPSALCPLPFLFQAQEGHWEAGHCVDLKHG